MLEKLKLSLEKSQVIKKGSYKYFVHPICDGFPQLKSSLLKEVIGEIKRMANLKVDKIVTIEAAGIWIAAALSFQTGISLNVIRKKQYNLPGEISVGQTTGYSKSRFYINGIKKGERLLLVDDTLSTGGTITPIVQALNKMGAFVVDIVVVVDRCENKEKIEKEIGQKIKNLVKIKVNDKVKVLE